jgi:hypothetical protein
MLVSRLWFSALLVLFAAGCSAGEGDDEKAPPGGPKSPRRGKVNDGASATVSVQGAPELSGRFWAGDLLCLPPATKVTINAGGLRAFRLVEDDAKANEKAWALAGGDASLKDNGNLQIFTPQLGGSIYRLAVSPDKAGAKDLVFRVAILHEAEMVRSKRKGTWRVTVGKSVIGTYPNPDTAKSWRVRMHKGFFNPPRYWMKISARNEKLQISPHVLVGQMVGFITEKDRSKPKRRHIHWFPPNRPLVYKLELLSRELARKGVKFKRLAINSCFRAPYYNRRIGGSSFSRHIYGDAADVMIDEDGDEVCDDITGDGTADQKDGLVIGQALRRLENAGAVKVGGTGVYGFDGKGSVRSYCHFDSRGYVTRWGYVYRGKRRKLLDWWPASEYREDEEPPPGFRDPPGAKKPDKGKRK